MAEVCRICKAPPVSGPLKNIFDEPQNSDTCIADMIAECSGHEVCRGDLLPENICPPCLEDAVAAFSFKKTCEQSHKPNFPVLEEAGGEAICGNQEDDAAWEPSDSGNELTNQLETDAKVQGDKDVYHQFKCSLCPKSYKHKSNLNRHKNVHTGIRPHKCSDCSKAFRLKTYLQAHIRTHTDERPYKCEHCSKTFKHKKSLKNHSRTHSEERPHKCMHCSKSFSHSGTFRNHVRTHTVERSFQCSDCSKAFKRQSDLNKHSRTHSVDRPYQCVLCSKSFKFKWHLSRHLRTHTGERPYSCADCPKAFKDKSSLKNHTCCRSQNDR